MSCLFSNLRTGRKETDAPLLGDRLPEGQYDNVVESTGQ